jgi:cell division protein FtsQ
VSKTKANGGATLLEEPADYYRPPADRDSDARTSRSVRARAELKADSEDDAGEPFLRARRRIPVRRGLLPSWARGGWGKLALGGCVLMALGVAAAMILGVRSYLDHDPRFRIDSSASIQTLGNSQLSRGDLLSVFGSDIGRNLFFVPLSKRRSELEQIPWVEKATVMRLLPNQLRVAIVERKPVAFVQVRGRVDLADQDGVILSITPQQMAARRYSFPVVSGINPADPLSVRSARMHVYERFIGELDATGEHISAQLSEVDLSNPDDVRATVPANGSDLVLQFGDEDFVPRWRNYQAHIAQWQQQYPHLASIDLRYEREVVLKMTGDPGTNAGTSPEEKPAEKPAAPATPPAAHHSTPAVHSSPAAHPTVHSSPALHGAPAHSAAHKPAKPMPPSKHGKPTKHGMPDKTHAKQGAA